LNTEHGTRNIEHPPSPESWDLIIRPKRGLLDINLREIWRYRDLVMLFVRRDFVARYKQTILGPLWFIIQPILTTLMFTIIFSRLAGISTDGLPPMLFYLAGTVAWTYFASCLNATSNTFIANAGIFGKVYFPRLTVPISIVISNLIQFGIQFMLLVAVMLFYYFNQTVIRINIYVLLIPYLIVLMALMGLGFGIIISSLTTKYRDLTNLVAFGMQLWMYATPVIYPLSKIPDKYKIYIMANPVTPIVETFRFSLLGSGTVSAGMLWYATLFTLVILTLGIVLFSRVEKSFMDVV
jgi:lipopolysaccharide transport system permease protein